MLYLFRNSIVAIAHGFLLETKPEVPFPEIVTIGKTTLGDLEFDDARTVDSTPLIFALINAVKELAAKNDALDQRVTAGF